MGIEDDAHSFWLYMPCGLVRIARTELDAWVAAIDRVRKRTIQATVFDSSDGVRSRAMASWLQPAGRQIPGWEIVVRDSDGVSVVDPRHLPFNSLPPPVHIEQITADRKTYDTTSATSGALRLPALTRDLRSITRRSASSRRRRSLPLQAGRARIATGRTSAPAARRSTTIFRPRNYRFRVIASNNSGVWNETGAALDFSIAPAYYQTAWFRTLAVVMFLSLLWAAHRIRLRVIERHQAEITALNESLMKAQEQERTRIAGELHDGVMQQISALTLMLGTAGGSLKQMRSRRWPTCSES